MFSLHIHSDETIFYQLLKEPFFSTNRHLIVWTSRTSSLLACLCFGASLYTNLTWTASIEYIAYLVALMLETINARTVLLMMLDIVTLRVIPSLTDSLIHSCPHITTLLNDIFVCFLFCWLLKGNILTLCEFNLALQSIVSMNVEL